MRFFFLQIILFTFEIHLLQIKLDIFSKRIFRNTNSIYFPVKDLFSSNIRPMLTSYSSLLYFVKGKKIVCSQAHFKYYNMTLQNIINIERCSYKIIYDSATNECAETTPTSSCRYIRDNIIIIIYSIINNYYAMFLFS